MTVLPILDYGDVVFRSASKTLLHKLDVIYHAAIRFVTGASFNTHHCHLYSLLNWSSLHSRRQIHWFLFIYKTLIGKTLLNFHNTSRNLHSSSIINFHIPKVRTSFGRCSFHFSAANDWNHLQQTLKLSSFISLASFKSLIQGG